MKKTIVSLLLVGAILTGCNEKEISTETTENVYTELIPEVDTRVPPLPMPLYVNEEQAETKEFVHTIIDAPNARTLKDFNASYTFDEYETNYTPGKFELQDGSIVYADWYFYVDGETFDFANAKFVDGQLVQAELSLKENVEKEEVLAEFGLPDDVIYEKNYFGEYVDITLNTMFHNNNIKRFANEWGQP